MRCEFSIMPYRNRKESAMLLLISHLLCGTLAWSLFSIGGCAYVSPNTIQGSGVAKTETRDVGAFSRIDSTGSADVIVTIGDKQSLTVEADDNILPLIDTEVKGDKLVISSHDSYSPRTDIKITITVPKLDEASVRGSGTIKASGVDAQDFKTQLTGSGDISLEGKATSLKATVTGSGSLDASKFTVGDADVRVSGSGDARINASKSLNASVSGSGDVQYSGNPSAVERHVSGSGSVRKA
jgi:hypothetical protein